VVDQQLDMVNNTSMLFKCCNVAVRYLISPVAMQAVGVYIALRFVTMRDSPRNKSQKPFRDEADFYASSATIKFLIFSSFFGASIGLFASCLLFGWKSIFSLFFVLPACLVGFMRK